MSDYKATLNLPKTDFAMKASLVEHEPQRLAEWEASDLYRRVLASREGCETFTLHDGPPFANGDIHLGHLLNKVLKDSVLRYKTMAGFRTPYVPGWDCHGLPIEHQVQQKLGGKLRELDTLTVRRLCREHAEKFISRQSQQFRRLGILGDWGKPYLTMDASYEARVLEVFARFVEKGFVYKRLKPVTWSPANRTALADAETEYRLVRDQSVFVEFPVLNPGHAKAVLGLREPGRVSLLIWTTTPWTLPANVAIAVNADVQYDLVRYERPGDAHPRVVAVASALREKVFAAGGSAGPPPTDDDADDWKATKHFFSGTGPVTHEVVATVRGETLTGLEYRHPFVPDRVGRVVTADYVTTTDGTGLVHTAPGHGEEDYETGLRHGLEVYCPVDPAGRYDSTVPPFVAGLNVFEANPLIVERLADDGFLFAHQDLVHKYPHDWRSKTPTIYRATEQWFIAMDKADAAGTTLREAATEAAGATAFHPAWGRGRLSAMLAGRPDWCVSRQRAWGLPIPVFYNDAGEPLLTPESVRAVARAFARHGSDAWWSLSPAELLAVCDTGPAFPAETLRKESDIFDVWFESGSSWHAVLDAREDLGRPADLYLEGSDQHRGWFQLSLLSALGGSGEAPYKNVLTHGFVVKPDGTKVSKSDPEYVTATQGIDRHGADLLRLWTCSIDYQGDVRTSPEIIAKFGDEYRKIRNTIRFLLGNLYDYDPSTPAPDVPARSLDGWMLAEVSRLVRDVREAYDAYLTHHAYRLIRDFCTVQVSQVYGNATKDRLYCDRPDGPARRRSQFVQHRLADALIRLVAPMLVFTADEAWGHLPGVTGSVHEQRLPEADAFADDASWPLLMRLRDNALLRLDVLKKEVGLNKATDAEVVYRLTDGERALLEPYGVDLADVVGAGWWSVEAAAGSASSVEIVDRREDWALCARSRRRTPHVGQDPSYPDLCPRDADAVSAGDHVARIA